MIQSNYSRALFLASLVCAVAAFLVAAVYANTLFVPKQALVLVLMAAATGFAYLGRVVDGDDTGRTPIVLFLLVMAYFLLRSLLSPIRDLANEDMVLISIAAMSFFVFAGLPGGSKWLLWSIVLVTAVQVGVATMQKFGIVPSHSTGRVCGLFGHYNYFANLAGVGLLASLVLMVWSRCHLAFKVLLGGLVCVCLLTIFWSQSRGTVTALAISGMVLWALSYWAVPELAASRRNYYRIALILAAVIGVMAGGYAVVQLFNARGEGASGMDVFFASTLRIYFVPMGIEQFQDAPLFGTGSRTFSFLCFQYWNPNIAADRPNPEFIHNEHVQMLAEYGMMGYLFTVGFLTYSIIRGVMLVRHHVQNADGPRERLYLPMLGVCILVFCTVHAVVDFTLHLAPNLILAVSGAVFIHGNAVRSLRKTTGRVPSAIITALIAIIVIPLTLNAFAFGSQELRAGKSLKGVGISRETGTWLPSHEEAEAMIPALTNAVEASPTFRRLNRLGVCYRIAASQEKDVAHVMDKLKMAELNFQRSVESNPLNPVAELNLAITLGDLSKWDEADVVFQRVMPIARVREPWLFGQLSWANMYSSRALADWKEGRLDESEKHFLHAIELAEMSEEVYKAHRDPRWLADYTKINIFYARLLTAEKKFAEADKI